MRNWLYFLFYCFWLGRAKIWNKWLLDMFYMKQNLILSLIQSWYVWYQGTTWKRYNAKATGEIAWKLSECRVLAMVDLTRPIRIPQPVGIKGLVFIKVSEFTMPGMPIRNPWASKMWFSQNFLSSICLFLEDNQNFCWNKYFSRVLFEDLTSISVKNLKS